MRILILFFGIIFIFQPLISQSTKKKKQLKKPQTTNVWTKQEILLFYESWMLEELQFPENFEVSQVPVKQEEIPKKDTTPIKIQFPKETVQNPFIRFFSENLKLILIVIAILSFALYRLRYGNSKYKPGGKIFSKFKDK